jgi:molybdopterin synthase catalytic subunit
MESDYLIKGPVTLQVITYYLDKIREKVNSGGHSVFLGQVRADEIQGRRVKAIEYSAYEAMINVEVKKIRQTVLSEFEDAKSIEIVHSTGVVNAGEISLFVFVSAGHRHHAMAACNKTVELIKERLPVWKKEIFDDDSHKWKQNTSDHTGS